MRTCLSSALLGVSATLLTLVLFWPGAAPTAHAQNDGVLQLDRDWNNVAYSGDPLPTEARSTTRWISPPRVWVWRSRVKTWDSWTKGAPALLNSLRTLDRGVVVWLRTRPSRPLDPPRHRAGSRRGGAATRWRMSWLAVTWSLASRTASPALATSNPMGLFPARMSSSVRVGRSLFGDANAIEFVVASAGDRFGLLARGEIDVLIRTTTLDFQSRH